MTDDKLHAEYSPSSLNYRAICPGYTPTEGTNPAAERGTRMHKAMETGTMDGLSQSECDIVIDVSDKVQEMEGVRERGKVYNEIKVDICVNLTFGTIDYLLITPVPDENAQFALLIDYKFGKRKVPDVRNNFQIIAYCIGVFEMFPNVEWVTANIIQPEGEDSYFNFLRSELPKMRMEIKQIIYRAQFAKDSFNAGQPQESYLSTGDQCQYCARIAECPLITKKAITVASRTDEHVSIPDITNPSSLTSPEHIDACYSLTKILEPWCKSVRSLAISKLEEGTNLKTWELTHRSGRRSIRGTGKLIRGLSNLGSENKSFPELDMDEMMSCCTAHLASIEKYIKGQCADGMEEEAMGLFRTFLADEGLLHKGDDIYYLRKKE